tara:strand:+ start:361 stop:609 length:249 start_codon:yes stop_codon:yes gene_type:complete
MKEIIILITMFFADPMYNGQDAITINSHNGIPLIFSDMDTCEKWVWNDLDGLKAYAKKVYPKAAAVKEIICVDKNLREGQEI